MNEAIFVSYRRADSQHAAFAIADRLRWAFGEDLVFFDRGSIRAGNDWPDALRRGLDNSRVLVVVIGRNWLATADEWGRRRIDDAKDWVRQEILAGLSNHTAGRTHVVPVLLEGAQRLRKEALDPATEALASIEPQLVKDDSWEKDIDALLDTIAATGLQRRERAGRNPNGSPARPSKHRKETPLPDASVREALAPLSRWELQWSPHIWGAGGQAQEITKAFDFDSFPEAVDFMAYAARQLDSWKPPHHPRWENQWKVVNVSFSTWDVDCRVTQLDIDAARKFDAIHAEWRKR